MNNSFLANSRAVYFLHKVLTFYVQEFTFIRLFPFVNS
jgi:hypothetical protein